MTPAGNPEPVTNTPANQDFASSSTEFSRLNNAESAAGADKNPTDPNDVHNLHTAELKAGMEPSFDTNLNEHAAQVAKGVKPALPNPEDDLSVLDKRRVLQGQPVFADEDKEYEDYKPAETKSNVPVNQLSSPGDSDKLYDEMGIHYGDRVIHVNSNDGSASYPPEETRRRYAMKVGPSFYNVGGLLFARHQFGVNHPGRWVGLQAGQPTFVPDFSVELAKAEAAEKKARESGEGAAPEVKGPQVNNPIGFQDSPNRADAPSIVGDAKP